MSCRDDDGTSTEEGEALTNETSEESPRSLHHGASLGPDNGRSLGFILLVLVLASSIVLAILAKDQLHHWKAQLRSEGLQPEVEDVDNWFGTRARTAPPAVCHNCAKAWDEAKVQDICRNAGSAEMRRLLFEYELEEEDDGDEAVLRMLAKGPVKRGDDVTKLSRYRVPTGGSLMYYGSQDLNRTRIAAKTMVIFLHGAARNSQDYFCTLRALVESSRMDTRETLIITPRFAHWGDEHGPDDCFWNGSRPMGDWRAGGVTDPRSPCNMSSFELLDHIVHLAGDRDKFPDLTDVKVLGFSAGGQTVHRYSVVSSLAPFGTAEQADAWRAVHDHLQVHFVVGNPGSFAYLDDGRWIYDCGPHVPGGGCTEPTYARYDPRLGRRGWDSGVGVRSLQNQSAATPFICRESGFNEWGYQLNWDAAADPQGFVPYLRRHENLTRAVKEWYPNRKVFYLVGQGDTCTEKLFPFCFDTCWKKDSKKLPCFASNLDSRCAAMLQGPNRAQRAINYMKHLDHFYGYPVHKLFLIPEMGHQAEAELLLALKMNMNNELHDFRVAVST